MKRELYAGLAIMCMTTSAMLAWAQDPAEEKPTPARNAFVKVFSYSPLAFNGVFVNQLDTETTATAAQKYGVLKALVLAEASVSPRNVGQVFTDAPPAVRALLKTTTKAILDQATSDTLAQAAIMSAEAAGALGDD
jgi:hypothetical protein